MKRKIISLLAFLLCFSLLLLSCSNDKEPQNEKEPPSKTDDKIQLTLDNYKDYLEISATTKAHDTETWIPLTIGDMQADPITTFKGVECDIEVKGNSHYEYSEATIIVKFKHYTKREAQKKEQGNESKTFSEETLTIKLSLAGNGSKQCTLNTPGSDYEQYPSVSWGDAVQYTDVNNIHDNTYFEVIEVSGYVTKY